MSAATPARPLFDYNAQADFVKTTMDASRTLVENAEAQKSAALAILGDCIRRVDELLAESGKPEIQSFPGYALGLKMLHETRTMALEFITKHAPDEAFLWTPEMQASLRSADAYFASGESRIFQSEEEFDAFLQEQSADV